jgi:hypothetical protein
MRIDKHRILEALRDKGLHDRADFVDRELPDQVDVDKNAGLLATLGLKRSELTELSVEPAGLSEVGRAPAELTGLGRGSADLTEKPS